jgi:hypothetical protein
MRKILLSVLTADPTQDPGPVPAREKVDYDVSLTDAAFAGDLKCSPTALTQYFPQILGPVS